MEDKAKSHDQQDKLITNRHQFCCSICFGIFNYPVVTFCGHMFWLVQKSALYSKEILNCVEL